MNFVKESVVTFLILFGLKVADCSPVAALLFQSGSGAGGLNHFFDINAIVGGVTGPQCTCFTNTDSEDRKIDKLIRGIAGCIRPQWIMNQNIARLCDQPRLMLLCAVNSVSGVCGSPIYLTRPATCAIWPNKR
jgi:hypothetical protein